MCCRPTNKYEPDEQIRFHRKEAVSVNSSGRRSCRWIGAGAAAPTEKEDLSRKDKASATRDIQSVAQPAELSAREQSSVNLVRGCQPSERLQIHKPPVAPNVVDELVTRPEEVALSVASQEGLREA